MQHSFSKTGLSSVEAAKRLVEQGLNRMVKKQQRSIFLMLLDQFKNLLVLLLVAAGVFSFVLGEYRDASILTLVVLLNAVIGFYQDWKSENILASLKNLIIQKCEVIRDGKPIEVPTETLVVGDLVRLFEGDGVPADMDIVEAVGAFANEVILTGETVPREKSHLVQVPIDAPLAERTNSLFMGTSIAKGEIYGFVTATGMKTVLGKIAEHSDTIDASLTPLQKELNTVARKITVVTLVIGTAMLLGRLFVGESLQSAIIFAIGVAAAMVPEGLPAQISISLALGVGRLAQKKAVVKKLSAVEALGAATVIASDKTGTITKNEMTIVSIYLNGAAYKVSGTGFAPNGEMCDLNDNKLTINQLIDLKQEIIAGFLASTGRVLPPDAHHPAWYPIGDPTESAFATLALKAKFDLEDAENQYPTLQLFPFDSFRKRIAVVRKNTNNNEILSFVKGSIESILEISAYQTDGQNISRLEAQDKLNCLEIAKEQAANGFRIIALAYKILPPKDNYTLDEVENELVFIGFATMIDPPRDEMKSAIAAAFEAKIKVMMVTGDNEITARAIATQIGMSNTDDTPIEVINDKSLAQMTDDEVKSHFSQRSLIFSRVSPDAKLRIISLLKSSGETVAVTGDGVNDTLSLKKADIGVAMGQNGSQVAQEAASMVLLDDNFSTIVAAIKEGRTIYFNLKKIVLANLNGNTAELTCILIGFVLAFFGLPLVLVPVHILVIDLIGNMLPLLMLSFDPADLNLMQQPPRQQGEMINKRSLLNIFFTGIVHGLLAFSAFWFSYQHHANDPNRHQTAVTVTFVAIIVCQIINVFSSRTQQSIFTAYFFANKNLFLGVFLSLMAMLLVSYVPFFNQILYTGALSVVDWVFVLGAALVYLLFFELKKWITKTIL